MRIVLLSTLLAAGILAAPFTGSSAFAQYRHHGYCLMTGSAEECAYDSFAQCEASKRGSTDFCEPNRAPINHPPRQ